MSSIDAQPVRGGGEQENGDVNFMNCWHISCGDCHCRSVMLG